VRGLVAALAVALAACGHEGTNLSGSSRVAPPGVETPTAPADPHGANPHAADPHAGMPAPSPAPAAVVAPVAWTVPAGWKETKPTSQMRLTQFDVGVDDSGAPVQCVVFQGIGGDDESNITRWISQMGDAAKDAAVVGHADHDGLTITRVQAKGAYTDSMRPGEPKTVASATMLAAIVASPAGKLHVKLVGPADVVEKATPAFDAFIASIKPK
jgi:hypothetical protein